MEIEGNNFIEVIENLKVKQNLINESILTLEEEKEVLSEQLHHVKEQLKVKCDALNECDKVINVAQKEYEQYTNMYKKSQSLLANLEKVVMDIGDFPIELNATYPRTGNHKTSRKDQGSYLLPIHYINTYNHLPIYIFLRLCSAGAYTDIALDDNNSESEIPSTRTRRERTRTSISASYTTADDADDADSTTQTDLSNQDDSAANISGINQYAVDCILGKILLIFIIRYY